MKKKLFDAVDNRKQELTALSDEIHDHPEWGGEEVFACGKLIGYLEKEGFSVERGVGGLPTAFRAVYTQGKGGPSIGLLCEYDALEGLGHGCGHHMQGPSCLGAAAALKEVLKDENFQIVVNKIPVFKLNELLMENAALAGAPGIAPPREKTGSTDFGNVMHRLPGACIRVRFVPEGTASHSQAYVDAGKTRMPIIVSCLAQRSWRAAPVT